ncbi:TlpA family protein disulfide reductase [Patescibacteria group bacterium AH-259-L05]|nr:TlpA family protein disulfide reductase [Patescibacteria group bacterium AH-259-L05]
MMSSMDKKAYSFKPFLPAVIFIIIIVGIYIFGQNALFKDSKDRDSGQRADVGFIAPDFVIKDVHGLEAPLSLIYSSRPVLLIFWSTWCPFCTQELPDLVQFNNIYKDDIQVILVISGESKQVVEKYVSDKNITFLASLDTSRAIWQLYNVEGTPHHFLINRAGEIIKNRPGLFSLPGLERLMVNIR